MKKWITIDLTLQEVIKLYCKRNMIPLEKLFKQIGYAKGKGDRKLLTCDFTQEELKVFEKYLNLEKGFLSEIDSL